MSNRTSCPAPFLAEAGFTNGGYVEGRLCQTLPNGVSCCLPCPMTDWAYPDGFDTMGVAADWVAVASTVCCVFLLLSWAVLPVDKTFRHYLSICLTTGVLLMNLGFVIPLAASPEQCFDSITPNSMKTSSVVVGRNFMWFSMIFGWGIPILGVVLAITLSGFSFRFGATCHINHKNSLADLWIPLLVFAGLTIIIQFSTFGYCIKVYLASLADNSASTEGSNLPSYTNSIRTMTPKQAYRRVRRVVALQWRGIAIVLIIIADVVFFSVVFVFQDNTAQAVKNDGSVALAWITCLLQNNGQKHACLNKAGPIVVNMPTVGAVLFLLGMNGIWLVLLLGRWTMVTGWRDMFGSSSRNRREFVSVDARLDDLKKDTRSYEMLSGDHPGKMMDEAVTPSVVTPVSPAHMRYMSPVESPNGQREPTTDNDGRRTPDYFGNTARYHQPAKSFSSPRPPQQQQTVTWDARDTYATRQSQFPEDDYVNPLGMNRI
ncbi:hypothetical protein B0H63DRAFT_517587 [Podospora didyma]|uniref:G-protein coupled receptors family 2 profile 2 domain-containing protein n=1 Tax=Podospora didyma TaxID=330526 RepID=A0AAE0P6Z8_9PEZI|nr:hypothetical protein B0H63DRAFT_517587 [Podospora didyma]